MSITEEQAKAMVAEAVKQATAPLVEKLASLSVQPPAPPPSPPPEPKVYTRAELDAAVSRGSITEAEASAVWDKQQAEQTERLVEKRVEEKFQSLNATSEVGARIGEYAAIKPEILEAGSAARAKVKAQYDYLVRTGLPETKATELAALGMIYGPIDALKAASAGRSDDETHQDVGGGEPRGGSDKIAKKLKLSADEKRYYQNAIDKGIYKDWDAVEGELKFANAKLRARHSAAMH